MNGQAASMAQRWSATAAVIIGLLLVGCGDGSSAGSVPATPRLPATPAPATTAPPVSSTQPPERLTEASRLRLDGIGLIRVGMTLEQAEVASDANLRMLTGSPGSDCSYFRPTNGPAGLAFMLSGRQIVRVDVQRLAPDMAVPRIATVSGIRVGSTEDEVKATYPGRITVQGHPYLPTGHYLVYNPDPANAQYGLIFETDGQRVTSFRSGYANQVQWTEGCS